MPSEPHFEAMLHYLHHIRCHPPNALCFYKDVQTSPLYGLIQSANLSHINPTLVTISDSSWDDSPGSLSTGSFLVFFQGGIISMMSLLPPVVSLSSAEAEVYTMSYAAMHTNHCRQVFCDIFFDDPDHPYTVPILTDSKSGSFITKYERDSKNFKHVERKFLYVHTNSLNGLVDVLYFPGKDYNVAVLGTKNCSSPRN